MKKGTTMEAKEKGGSINLSKILWVWQRGGIYTSLIVVALALSFLSPRFLTRLNLIELLNYTAIISIVALGQTFVLAGKGIDLSVGSVVALTACMMAWVFKNFAWNSYATILFGLAFATGIGTLHGFIIAKFGVPDLIVTLAGMESWRGLVYLLFEERVLWGFSPTILFFGRYRIGWLPVSIVLVVGLVILCTFIIRKLSIGRYILAIGGNRKAAEYAGISYVKHKILSYSFSGLFCGIAALVLLGRLNAVQSSLGIGYELHSVASTAIGGTSLFGGIATFPGTIAGVMLIAMIRNGLILGRINFYWYMIILGILLVVSVGIPAWERRRSAR